MKMNYSDVVRQLHVVQNRFDDPDIKKHLSINIRDSLDDVSKQITRALQDQSFQEWCEAEKRNGGYEEYFEERGASFVYTDLSEIDDLAYIYVETYLLVNLFVPTFQFLDFTRESHNLYVHNIFRNNF